MKLVRRCSKPQCHNEAVATLTYSYRESTVVLGPMSTVAEPHTYDLCRHHVESFKAPRGWTVHQLTTNLVPAQPHEDDLDALAQVVRKASRERVATKASYAVSPESASGGGPQYQHKNLSQTVMTRPGQPGSQRPEQTVHQSASAQKNMNHAKIPTYDDQEIIRVGHLRLLRGYAQD
ncbi:MAG: DUF3499 domain-containing protein [Actinomycetaceae bacterium]|nr:DUF3499 domain-containing protein [Actinomycetaceae bacterium]